MRSICFNSNQIADPVLHRTEIISDETAERVVAIALPFLSLHPVTGTLAAVAMGGYHINLLRLELPQLYSARDWEGLAKKSALFCLVVACTVSVVVFPFGHFILSHTWGVCTNLYALGVHLGQEEWKEAACAGVRLLGDLVFVGSVLTASLELIAISLLIQGSFALLLSYREFARGRTPEGIAHLLLAGIRLSSTYSHGQTLRRNYFGKRLSQEQWNRIYQDKVLRGSREIERLLAEENISSHIQDIRFVETADLSNGVFKNMRFKQCDFTGVDFQDSYFFRVTADSSLFTHSTWVNTVVQNCRFQGCDFNFSHFNDALLDRVLYERCALRETSFLGAQVYKSQITHSDLTDTLLLNTKEQFQCVKCTPNRLTKPVVALSWKFKERGVFSPVIAAALKKNGAIVMRYECKPEESNIKKLGEEIEEALGRMPLQQLISQIEPGTEMAKIAAKAELYARYMDGLALPGGEDLEPIYYQGVSSDSDPDHRRSFMEFNMIFRAKEQGKPIMGTCRGSQMLNVAHGGTLNPDVPGHRGVWQQMEIVDSSHAPWAKEVFGENFVGLSVHHQASEKIGEDLEVVLKVGDVPKLIMNKEGNIIAVQFHPEIYVGLEAMAKELSFSSAKKTFSKEKYRLFKDVFASLDSDHALYRHFIGLCIAEKKALQGQHVV